MDNQVLQARLEKINRIKERAVRMIWVTFQREGIHKYPAAATDPNLTDVSFLANPHRHIFHFKVGIEVFHNDRDIEFIQFKRLLESLYSDKTLQLDYKSCEMIADDIYNVIALRYPERYVEISVSEDNENGCLIRYNLSYPQQSIII
jgi:hypothetical protein